MWHRLKTIIFGLKYRWGTSLALLAGIMLAVGLAAAGPTLIDNVLTFALRRSMLNTPVAEGNIALISALDQDRAAYELINEDIHTASNRYFSSNTPQIVPTGTLPTILPWQNGQPLSEQRIDIQFYGSNANELDHRITLVAGQWPPTAAVEPGVIPALIGEPFALAFDLSVGDRLPLSNRISATQPNLWLEVNGIARANDANDLFWYGRQSPLIARFDNRFVRYSALIDPEQFFEISQSTFPEQKVTFSWHILFDPNVLEREHLDDLPTQVVAFENELRNIPASIRVSTRLAEILTSYQRQANQLLTPLVFMTLTTTLLAFLFLGMAAQLAAEQQRSERMLMSERGLTRTTLITQQAGRAAFLCVLGLPIGLLFANLLLLGLSAIGPLATIQDISWAIRWPNSAWTAGAIATFGAFALILWPYLKNDSRPRAAYGRQTIPLWQRIYADLIFLTVGALLMTRFWWLGGFIGNEEALTTDWLLVLAPILAITGTALLLLRLLPRLLNLMARMGSNRSSLTPFLAIAYAARSQGQTLRLILLFALTVTLGLFASSVDAALSYNETNRAIYATGGQMRMTGLIDAAPSASWPAYTTVWRGRGSFEALGNADLPAYDILAIDPESIAQVANVPDSFAADPILPMLDELPSSGQFSRNVGLPLPENTAKIGLWFQLPLDEPSAWNGIDIDIKTIDQNGQLQLSRMANSSGVTAENGWRYYETSLTTRESAQTHLHSIWIRSRTFEPGFRVNLSMDELVAIDHAGAITPLDSFDDELRGWVSNDFSHGVVPGDVNPYAGSGKMAIRISTPAYSPQLWMGVLPINPAAEPLSYVPGLVSRQFADLTSVQPGDELEVRLRLSVVDSVPAIFRVTGVVDYFPTLYDSRSPYIIVSQDQILAIINERRHLLAQSTEYWLADSTAEPSVIERAAQITTAAEIEQSLRAYPLSVGLRSASYLGYILATVISLGGFAAHLVFVLQKRQNQFAVLRAIGLQSNQLYRLLAIEHLVLVLAGLLLGTGFGLTLSWFTLNNLNFNWGGLAAEPPFVVIWDVVAINQIYLYFGLTMLIALGLVVWISRRASLQQALRLMME